MLSFDCHFNFNTTVQTHGRNEEGALENIVSFLNEDVINEASEIMYCGVDFDREEYKAKEVFNGWFQFDLRWSGYFSVESENESDARVLAEKILNERLDLLFKMLENISTTNRRFQFNEMNCEEVTDILEY